VAHRNAKAKLENKMIAVQVASLLVASCQLPDGRLIQSKPRQTKQNKKN